MVTAKKVSDSAPKAASVAKTAAPKAVSTVKASVPAKAPAAKKAAAAKPKARAVADKVTSLSTEQRNHYVEVAAFYIAERRGFTPGNPADDWRAAEIEVDRLIATGQFAK
jgi:hypothetical protein